MEGWRISQTGRDVARARWIKKEGGCEYKEVIPFLFSDCILAPLASMSCTTATLELSMARLSGVPPFMATASISAPQSRRYSTRSTSPAWHAWWSGDHLKLSLAFTFALEIITNNLNSPIHAHSLPKIHTVTIL